MSQATLHTPVNKAQTALLVVDPQKAFGAAVPVPHVTKALEKMRLALSAWRKLSGLTILTKHTFNSYAEVGRVADFLGKDIFEALKTGSPLAEFHPDINDPTDLVIAKTRFNALIGTNLELVLREQNITTVVVAGLTTPICVQATVDGLSMAGFKVVLLEDACASQAMGAISAEAAHQAAVERMRYLFAEVCFTDSFLTHIQQ